MTVWFILLYISLAWNGVELIIKGLFSCKEKGTERVNKALHVINSILAV